MAWDKTEPTNTTKIRNLGVVIRPNWDAIETADSTFQPEALNFTDRNAGGIIPTNPAAISTAYILYSRQDSGGVTELFASPPAGTPLQLTKGTPTHGTNGKTFLPGTQASGGILLAWNRESVASGGTVTVSALTTIYSVNITIDDISVTPSDSAYVFNVSSNTFRVRSKSGNAVTIYWQAIGI